MKTTMMAVMFALAVLFGGAVAKAGGQPEVRQKVEKGSRVSIRMTSGSVKVTVNDSDEIVVDSDSDRREGQTLAQRGPGSYLIDMSGRGEVVLRVSVPRGTTIEDLSTRSADVFVSDLGPVSLNTTSGNIEARNVGAASIKTRSGDITLSNVAGAVEIQSTSGDLRAEKITGRFRLNSMSGDVSVTGVGDEANVSTLSGDLTVKECVGGLTFNTTSGNLTAVNIGGDLTCNTISGDVNLTCVKGRVEVGAVSGEIKLAGISGEVEAETTSGDVTFIGPLKVGGRYYLKAFSGEVRMLLPNDTSGFTVKSKSFNGTFESDFPVTNAPGSDGVKRINATFGDGRTQLNFDTFSGTIKLVKSSTTPDGCAPQNR
jgi:DUF4097 and DUF4098 domain-containing protein YvlB